MGFIGNSKTVAKAAGAATVAAPYVRALASDEELRGTLRDLAKAVNHLYGVSREDGLRTLATDESVRKDVDRIVASLQESVRRVAEDTRPRRHWGRWMMIIGIGSAAAGAIFFWRSRSSEPVM
jgi:hypothetical protein